MPDSHEKIKTGMALRRPKRRWTRFVDNEGRNVQMCDRDSAAIDRMKYYKKELAELKVGDKVPTVPYVIVTSFLNRSGHDLYYEAKERVKV